MKIGEKAEALEIVMAFLGGAGTIHPVVLWDSMEGVTLVDAGLPGQLPEIKAGLEALGLGLRDVRRLLLTHQDLDHIGSADAVVKASGAVVFAHEADVPYIQGEKPLLKLDAGRYEARLQGLPDEQKQRVRAILASPPRVRVQTVLRGGEELPFHGGIVVIPTPGHTPGHVCYYMKSQNLLLAGDAMRVEEGSLIGPSPMATPDMRSAVASLKNLLPFTIDSVLCYHGGPVSRDVAVRLRELARIGA
jgi:glyoxylase-like metal-dependent hydrolase (beta-lactamase superfamily II)